MTDDAADSILIRTEGSLGRLTLNRPRAINALDLDMVRALTAALEAWRDDTDIQVVLLDGAGDRGLCAGGDVRTLYEQLVAGRIDDVAAFFRAEYALNAMIAEYPKPIVAIADGITMGGGIGLAGHAAIRVVTERSKLAMPETRIGFTPDVGGTYLLGRAPGRLGEYLGVTGAAMNGADAVLCGFADYYVPSERLDSLREALSTRADPGTPSEIVLLFDETPDAAPLAAERGWIDEVFSAGTLGEVAARLAEREEPAAVAAAATMAELAPTGMAVTLDAVRAARDGDLRRALDAEYRHVLWFGAHHPDIVEGIRAQIIDKDRTPAWRPATIDGVDAETLRAAHAYEPARPLWG